MKEKPLQKDLGATAACTVRLTEECHQQEHSTKDLVMGDAWFGSVKAATELAKRHSASILQVKTNSKLFPKDYISKALENAPGGTHIVMKATHQEVPLVAIGYRYSSRKTLHFVITEDAGSTTPGECYEMKFADSHGNVHIRYVDRPEVISMFFTQSNCVDKHNQARQYELALEKKWKTDDAYFRLATTMIGMNVTDVWKLASHHKLLNRYKETTVKQFGGILAKQLMVFAKQCDGSFNRFDVILSTDNSSVSSISNEHESSPKKKKYHYLVERGQTISMHYDVNGGKHPLCKFPQTKGARGKIYRKARRCNHKECKKQTVFFCVDCGPKCHGPDSCFLKHVCEIRKKRKRGL